MVGTPQHMQGSGKRPGRRSSRLLAFAERLLKAAGQQDAFIALERYARDLGFDHLNLSIDPAGTGAPIGWSTLGDAAQKRLEALCLEAEIAGLHRTRNAPAAIAWSTNPAPGIYSFFEPELRDALISEDLRGGIYFRMEVAPGRIGRAHALLSRYRPELLSDESRKQFHIAAIQTLVTIEQLGPLGPGGDLTPREFEVIGLAARGMSIRSIAAAVGVTESTIKFHLSGVRTKMGAKTTVEAVSRLMHGKY